MTVLAARPVTGDQLDLLAAIADVETPLGKLRAEDFRAACEAVGRRHDGWVHPSLVHAELIARFGEINPRAFSSKWGGACGPNGFMDKTNHRRPIDPEHSQGNGAKDVRLRRLRGWGPYTDPPP